MQPFIFRTFFIILWGILIVSGASAQECVDCHKQITPNIVSDWQLSKHSQGGVNCSVCHSDQHKSAQDIANVRIPTPETCAICHGTQVQQFKGGKHASRMGCNESYANSTLAADGPDGRDERLRWLPQNRIEDRG